MLAVIEILLLVGAVGGIATRARQRRMNPTTVTTVTIIGLVFFWLLGGLLLGMVGIFVYWGWLGAVWLYVENAHRDRRAGNLSWQCPECTAMNDPGTVVCLCGYDVDAASAE